MKEEQLNEAAEKEALSDSIAYEERYESFIKGARWHESLPLAERLTEEEKEKIRNIYKSHAERRVITAQDTLLVSIFGKDLFTDKTE